MSQLFLSLPTCIEFTACVLGSFICLACFIAGTAAFMTWYHTYRMSIPDEFESSYDPYAVVSPKWNNIDGVRTAMFQDVATLHSWIVANVPDENRRVQLYLQAIIAKETTGIFRFTVELSSKERDGKL